jgi:hypothetical protein
LARNGFVLLLPVLGLNLALASRLPAAYWDDAQVPSGLLVVETGLRVLVFAGPLVIRLSLARPSNRVGLVLFVVGTLAYAACWVAAITVPGAPESLAPIVALGPYWLPAVYFAGIALMGNAWWYLVPVTAFTVVHTWHGVHSLGLS